MSKSNPQIKHARFVHASESLVVKLLDAAGASEKNDVVVIDDATRAKAKTVLNSDKKALNSMASIIGRGGSGAVGAVCHDGDKFLLSTNKPDDEGEAQKLFNFIRKNSDQLRQEIYSHAVSNIEKDFPQQSFSAHLRELQFTLKNNILNQDLIKRITRYSKIKTLQEKIKALEELSPLANDVLSTYKAQLSKKVRLRNFLTELYMPAKHIQRVTQYNKGEKADLLVPDPQFVAQENTHAEMNIVNELFMQGKLLGEQRFFIGDTKKCCASCHIVITSVNAKTSPNKIEMSGTHGTVYIPWQKPEFLRLDEGELRKVLGAKGHSTDQINDLVKLAEEINSAFEKSMNRLIEEVKTRGSRPLSERQARSVSPLARSEDISPEQISVPPHKMTQEEREQKNLVDDKRKKAQKLHVELRNLQNSLDDLLQKQKDKLPELQKRFDGVRDAKKQLSEKIISGSDDINKCIQTQEEQEKAQQTKQELYKRYQLQLQKIQEIWKDSPEGEVQNAATAEINRTKELKTEAKKNFLLAQEAAESTLRKYEKFKQVSKEDNKSKEELSREKTKIAKQIANLNTKIEDSKEKIKKKSDELNKAKAEWKASEEKLTQTGTVEKKEEIIVSKPTNPEKRSFEGSKQKEPLIKKAKTGEGNPPKPKDIPLSIEFPRQQAAPGKDIEAPTREEVKQKQTFTPIEFPEQNVKSQKKRVLGPHHLDKEESVPINKKQKLTESQPLKPEVIFNPIQYPPKQTPKHTIPLQKSIVTSKEVDTKKSEKVVKQSPTSTKGEGVSTQAVAIGQEIKPFVFVSVVAPAQSGDKGKRKIPPQSISKRGKGRSGPRGKY